MAADRLVVVAPNWLGDAVMALPALADIRRHYPSAHLAVAARGSVAPLFTMVQGVDEVITLPGRGGWRALTSWQQDAAVLAGGGFDAALLLPNSFAAGLAASRSGIAERWGFATDWRARYLTRAVPRPRVPLHQGAYYQALTTALGATKTSRPKVGFLSNRFMRDLVRFTAGRRSGQTEDLQAHNCAGGQPWPTHALL